MISDAIRSDVRGYLAGIEREHGVRVLFACESGSRAWGFPSPDSDFDVRFIYVHQRDWYLSIERGRDVIEIPISGDMDIAGWDLQKALGLARSGNATLSEWLASPVVYQEEPGFAETMRGLLNRTYRRDRTFMHYKSVTEKNLLQAHRGKGVRVKKFLYSLRTALAAQWCATREDRPPMTLAALADALVPDAAQREGIGAIVEAKATLAEKSTYEAPAELVEFLEERIAGLAAAEVPTFAAADAGVFDGFFREWVGQERARS